VDTFGQMQVDRWELIDNEDSDTIWRCRVHNSVFDVEQEPCPDCWEEYSEDGY